MAENAERGVVFTLKANVDPGAKQIVEQFAQDIQAKQSAIDEAIRNAAQASAVAIQNQTNQAATVTVQATESSKSAIEDFFANTEQAAQAYADRQTQRAQEESARQASIRDISLMTAEELVAEREAILAASFQREEQLLQSSIAAQEEAYVAYQRAVDELRAKALNDASSITDEEIENAKRLQQEAIDSLDAREKAEQRFRSVESKERQRSVNEAIAEGRRKSAEEEKLAEESRKRYEDIKSSASSVIGAFAEGTEAVTKFAGGIAKLGLIGETDLQKLTDSLLAIQGSVDVMMGLAKGVKAASDGYDAYRKMVQLATEAQLAHNAAIVAGNAAQAGSDAAQLPLMARAVAAASNIGGSIAGAAGTVGLTAGGSGIAVFIASLGSAAASVAGLSVAALAASEALKNGIGGGAASGGIVESIGTSSMNPFFQIMRNTRSGGMLSDERGDAKKAYDDAEAAEKRLKVAQEQRRLNLELEAKDQAAINQMTVERAGIMAAQAQVEKQMEAERLSALTTEERRADLIEQITATQQDAGISDEERSRKIIDLSRQRLQAEREIYQEQRRAAEESLKAEQDKLASIDERIQRERESTMSAAERFGLMTPEEQQQLLQARAQFEQGAANVDPESLRRLRGFSGALDEQIAAEARRRAGAAGFGAFQQRDLQNIQALEAQRQQIEVSVKAKADVVARLEVDANAVAKEINTQIQAQWSAVLQGMASQIGVSSAKIRELEESMQRRFSRIPQ